MIPDIVPFLITYVGVPGLLVLVGYIWKDHVRRIEELERTNKTFITEIEVRQLLADKLEPIKESINKIQGSMEKITDILINKKF